MWVEAISLPTNDASAVARFLKKNIFTRFGTLRVIISDQAYKTPISTSLHKLIFGKACYLSMVDLEHIAYWAIKKLNLDLVQAGEKRLLQLLELDEFNYHAYENAKIYKERTKRIHDKHIQPHEFEPGQLALLYNSRLKIFGGKLKSKWSGPIEIVRVIAHGALELKKLNYVESFLVNGQRVKHYFREVTYRERTSMELEES
ncbi:uncharacterized protein LOC132613282 [Lycium barbarum]|uniref:uncharacterized protein LOC132613282 n=1 Tax=Lycium barbarum TaxID=112863 RepID=UPI00293EB3E3|nr:uncharacterized protein LOC132613282 [Lycium barbarum]